MIVKLLTEHHLVFLSLKGGGTGSSKFTLVKMSNCWKSQFCNESFLFYSFPSGCVLPILHAFLFTLENVGKSIKLSAGLNDPHKCRVFTKTSCKIS